MACFCIDAVTRVVTSRDDAMILSVDIRLSADLTSVRLLHILRALDGVVLGAV